MGRVGQGGENINIDGVPSHRRQTGAEHGSRMRNYEHYLSPDSSIDIVAIIEG